MTGLEKMKSQILNEAELSAKKILDEAKQDAEKVMQTAKENVGVSPKNQRRNSKR